MLGMEAGSAACKAIAFAALPSLHSSSKICTLECSRPQRQAALRAICMPFRASNGESLFGMDGGLTQQGVRVCLSQLEKNGGGGTLTGSQGSPCWDRGPLQEESRRRLGTHATGGGGALPFGSDDRNGGADILGCREGAKRA